MTKIEDNSIENVAFFRNDELFVCGTDSGKLVIYDSNKLHERA